MHVLVGGPPASGKTTLAGELAAELGLCLLSKDVVKDAIMAALGRPADVTESRRLGRAAVHAVLACARTARPGSVIDSTWFEYTRPLVEALSGPVIEVRCEVDEDEALRRYAARSAAGRGGHLDAVRTHDELRDPELLRPLAVGPVITVDTSTAVDVPALAAAIRRLAASVSCLGRISD
jgi:predicted kinase